MAKPGEFTMRAYLNGKLDLTQAEAVNDIIKARTGLSKAAALNQLEGRVFERIDKIHSGVMDLLAEVEASIDHDGSGEYFFNIPELKDSITKLAEEIDEFLRTASAGRMMSSGVSVAIIGAPNTGKSSIMNSLLGEDRVIVAGEAGTTRDVIHESLSIMGIPVHIYDTAGLRNAGDHIEMKGIEKTMEVLGKSDLRIVVFDCSRKIRKEDERIAGEVTGLDNIFILNKIDLDQVTSAEKIESSLGVKAIRVSALTGEGLEKLEKAIFDYYFSFGYNPAKDTLIANVRQEGLLRKVKEFLLKARHALEDGLTEEFAASDIRRARLSLEEITGLTSDESLLDKIFSKFCIGK
jgi:tRNA modification GTPase